MADLTALKAANAARWSKASVTRGQATLATAAHSLLAGKPRYMTVANATGVPWFVIAVIHMREASQNWNTQLGQGDPLSRVSTHVPKGRGPFKTWEEGAIDALVNCAPYASRNKDWSPGGTLTLLESYNGLGYANKGRPSPYVWSFTDQYVSGKYVADGTYSATTVDTQPGCAALIKTMMALDPTILFGTPATITPTVVAETQQPVVPPHPATAPAVPSITNPAAGSVVAWLISLFRKH